MPPAQTSVESNGSLKSANSAPRTACSVIVLNHNGRAFLGPCLDSLAAQTGCTFETIVIDNGSTDGSVEMVAQSYPQVRTIALPDNRGFSIANNIAIRDALARGAEFVLLLNNDTFVAQDFVTEMLSAIKVDARIAAVCPKIYFAARPDHFWYAGGDFNLWTGRLVQHGWKCKDVGQFDHRCDITGATGCAILLRASALREAGLLDEVLWAYLEDVEWSIRLRQHGYLLRLAPKARVWHHDGATWIGMLSAGSGAKRQYYSTRNMVLIGWKHARWWQIPTYALGFIINELGFYTALRIWRRDFPALWALYRGAAAGVLYIVRDRDGLKRTYPAQDCG